MKPGEKKSEVVFRIINRTTGEAVGSFSRTHGDQYDFLTAGDARDACCLGTFQDTEKYKIAKYRVVYELLDGDV